MTDMNELKKLAIECGFSHVGDLDVSTIELRTEARDMCALNKCQKYNKSWSCPPGCSTLDECGERLRKYGKGLIVQSTGELEDSLDFEAMMALNERHRAAFEKFGEIVRKEYPGCMIMGSDGCSNCEECTYPANPCRFPDKMTSNMEAYGMIVSDVCAKNNIKYYYGPGTLTYVGCVLLQ
jgi:predicted metal-binding protein